MPEQEEHGLGQELLVAWYGDDFTGAAAVMEVLSFAAVPSMLFLDVPTKAQLSQFPGLLGVGIASTARTQSPDWMDETLPAVFDSLVSLNPRLIHYKVCSTLDSSPDTGSIGRAIEIGSRCMSVDVVPVMIAAPQMQRYQCFGHLFAGVGDDVVRLDLHPVMSRHPVTPMTESDVARHITKQSDRIDGQILTLTTLAQGNAALPVKPVEDGRLSVVTIDGIDANTDAEAGKAIWNARQQSRFVVGSQGVEYALIEHWQRIGLLEKQPKVTGIGRSKKMVSVSGSVSPITADQIAWADENGFACIAFDASQIREGPDGITSEVARVIDAALESLSEGLDPLIFTARGPDDPGVDKFKRAVAASNLGIGAANEMIGEALGQVLHELLRRTGITRAVVSGGDTSGFATRQLGIFALSALAPTIPGAAICRAHATGEMDGLELALKGGQMGSPDYFGWIRDGGGSK